MPIQIAISLAWLVGATTTATVSVGAAVVIGTRICQSCRRYISCTIGTISEVTDNPTVLHPEGLYAFRFDLNEDAREELTFKFRFSEPHHADGEEHTHVQKFQVRRATGDDAKHGAAGDLLVEGETGRVESKLDVRRTLA